MRYGKDGKNYPCSQVYTIDVNKIKVDKKVKALIDKEKDAIARQMVTGHHCCGHGKKVKFINGERKASKRYANVKEVLDEYPVFDEIKQKHEAAPK